MTSSVWTAANEVSSPVVPIGACSNGTSFSSRACGAWSVAMQSMTPSRRPSMSAWRSRSVRSGGFIFIRVSSAADVLVRQQRWCGVASQVTCTPAAFAAATASTDSTQLRCCMCMRPPS